MKCEMKERKASSPFPQFPFCYNNFMDNLFDEYMKNRPQRLCKNCGKCCGKFANSPWDKLPDGCGYEGWFFQIREEIKQKVRRQKEDLLFLEVSLKNPKLQATDEQIEEINQTIEKIKTNIEIYAKYGSKDW